MILKKGLLSFDSAWVLSKKEDDTLPVDAFLRELESRLPIQVVNSSLTECEWIAKDAGVTAEQLESTVNDILRGLYAIDLTSDVVSFSVSDYENQETAEAPAESGLKDVSVQAAQTSLPGGILDQTEGTATADKEAQVKEIMDKVNGLVGAEEFKALCAECVRMAPGIAKYRTHEAFTNQSYLFAINDGNGLSTYLHLFTLLLETLGLFQFSNRDRRFVEERLAPPQSREGESAFSSVLNQFQRGGKLVCVDISEWMTKTNDKSFKNFLSVVEDCAGRNLVVFRVPFVENDILKGLNRSLGDMLFIRNVAFVPFTGEELTACAKQALTERGFTMEEEAWTLFHARMAEEKNDGRFYGINTVNKVVREMIYRKQLHNALNDVDDALIKREEIAGLAASYDETEKSGLEMLDDFVGMEVLKARVMEIVAQIETALKNRSLGSPCIHMRFVGNPGTGKTTVARVIGRILKEKGILRNGSFFEYTGRDFCGRYVGETAPKTASMCRDAYGSVLFIDEAYALYRGDGFSNADYGREAIDTLIAEMENHRSDLVVIMAGYPDEMETLMKGNAGLASRMPYVVEFPNYTREQLFQIFMLMVNRSFTFGEGFEAAVKEYFDTLPDEVVQAKEFSNARFVRNLFERTWGKAVLRAQMNKEDSSVLTKEDFLLASAEKEFKRIMEKKPHARLGFL